MLPYVDRLAGDASFDGALIGIPFMIAAGYHDHPALHEWFSARINVLYETAKQESYDIYVSSDEAQRVPKAWRGKPIYRPQYYADRVVRLPSCYDFYGLAHWPCESGDKQKKVDTIIAYLSDPRYQDTQGGYLWDTSRNTCYAAGRVFLACLTEARRVLFLELASRFAQCRRQLWFRDALADLEQCRTDNGTYLLPSCYLKERRDGYYIYGGDHMGLGENRRTRNWRETESTFRMLNINRLLRA